MGTKELKLIEEIIISLLLVWLGYLFFYQNYLLYKWHRGLPLPSKAPFLMLGILLGGAYFVYEWHKLGKTAKKEVQISNISQHKEIADEILEKRE
ncbi:hypothetical protein PAP_08270 [Palaeococcus pacificus DY20341]|uniref:Uncharacterized protein n=1 Tax=Palaeococcus pacificus DY20341 TaxID=1343739 RepID=A0A075LVK1_9EURY|nr:hypothetical protein [Palaeococcus pacificus]AIF70042.1 hypothetical protein PAP_08270 [Palaeococcus pacificus DY20341]